LNLEVACFEKYRIHMADDLRRSVENLVAPQCDDCNLRMKWHSGRRVEQADGSVVIEHHFQCSKCTRFTVTFSSEGSNQMPPPSKLSHPAAHLAA
jgi:hypothetical protein